MWGFKTIFKNWANSEVKLIDILLIPIKAIEPYWYLYVLIILYILFSSEQIQKIEWKKVLTLLGIISMVASWMPTVHWLEITKLLYFSFFFLFGAMCGSEKDNIGYASNCIWSDCWMLDRFILSNAN